MSFTYGPYSYMSKGYVYNLLRCRSYRRHRKLFEAQLQAGLVRQANETMTRHSAYVRGLHNALKALP